MSLSTINSNFIDKNFSKKFELAILSFTLLEVDKIEPIVNKLNEILQKESYVFVIIPDVLLDIFSTSEKLIYNLENYIEGTAILNKVDKFTDSCYPFNAHRVEHIILQFVTNIGSLISFKKFSKADSSTFLMIFKKMAGTNEK